MMKPFFILFSCFQFFNCQSQWFNLNSGTTEWLRGVWFTHQDTGVVVGYNGTILRSNNGGTSWTSVNSGSSNHLLGIHFINSSTGWIVGNNGTILKTTNGGQSWFFQNSGTNAILHQPFFIDLNNGFIAGENGVCLKTSNGGNTWSTVNVTSGNSKVSVFFINSAIGFFCGAGTNDAIIKTIDGGTNWFNNYNNTTEEFSSIIFTSTNVGYAVSDLTGQIAMTTNGGVTWNSNSSGVSSLYSIKFPSPNVGFAVGGFPSGSSIIHTNDGGLSWSQQLSSTSQPLFDVFFVNNSLGYSVGKNGVIIKTINTGLVVSEKFNKHFFSIFPNPTSNNTTVKFTTRPNFATLQISNNLGEVLHEYKNINSDEFNFNCSELGPGMYQVRLVENYTVHSINKLIISK